METVGDLVLSAEWRIKEFLSLRPEVDKSYIGPSFSFGGTSWRLRLFPNGRTKNFEKGGSTVNSEGHIDLYLQRTSPGPPITLKFGLGLKGWPTADLTFSFEKIKIWGCYNVISRSELLEKKSELLPSGVLTVVCKMTYPKAADISGNNVTERCSYCKTTLDAQNEDLPSHEKKCMEKPIKCPECSNVVALIDWYDHKCEAITSEASEKLLHDFKAIMLSGDHSDVVVKVKEEEFQLHRSILAARNPYFDSMFKNDMKEKSTGLVTVKDCEVDTFRAFIHFIYTGKVDTFTPENVFDLYEIADKYQEDQLKKQCLNFMVNTLSVDNFCDYFALAIRHDEKELFQKSIELFTATGKEIARSVKWQIFMTEYPTQANELFIKTLDHYVK